MDHTTKAGLEERTLLKSIYKRVKQLANTLWVEDIAIMLVCTKCNTALKKVGDDDHLVCACRERIVR